LVVVVFTRTETDPQGREFQVVQDGPILRVLVVPRHPPNPAAAAADDELETRLHHGITRQLLEIGVHHPHITVERRQALPRTAGGKLKLVIANPAPQPVDDAPAETPTQWPARTGESPDNRAIFLAHQ
jgi:hypothetical protein